MNGCIHDHLITAAKANDFRMITVGAVRGWFGNLCLYLIIMFKLSPQPAKDGQPAQENKIGLQTQTPRAASF
ncbi:MAG: hypothetical protein WC340_15485 [Kiritimatiellia bacterium]